MFSPDIYADEFEEFCDAYRHGRNPLLIPETGRDFYAAERMFYAYGKSKAIGISPFGIDTIWEQSVLYKSHYGILKQVSRQLLKAQREDRIYGFHFTDAKVSPSFEHQFGDIIAHVNRIHSYGKPQSGFGLIMQTADNEFLGVGCGYAVDFSSLSGKRVEILSIHEGHYPDGEWQETRRLNGDESASNSRWQFASVSPDYGNYHVPLCFQPIQEFLFAKYFVIQIFPVDFHERMKAHHRNYLENYNFLLGIDRIQNFLARILYQIILEYNVNDQFTLKTIPHNYVPVARDTSATVLFKSMAEL